MESTKARFILSLRREIRDRRVLAALLRVPRERFVPPEYRQLAYGDMPLPIGGGQTISQPFMVAIMTQELRLTDSDVVLEIGTGSGYQAAVLAALARRVVTVERLADLAETARARLASLGYDNVDVHVARDDQLGWPDDAPYDAIVVTAAAPRIPPSLLAQLRDGGRMVVPVGSREEQELLHVEKRGDRLLTRHVTYCRFVPLLGPDGWPTEEDFSTRPG